MDFFKKLFSILFDSEKLLIYVCVFVCVRVCLRMCVCVCVTCRYLCQYRVASRICYTFENILQVIMTNNGLMIAYKPRTYCHYYSLFTFFYIYARGILEIEPFYLIKNFLRLYFN